MKKNNKNNFLKLKQFLLSDSGKELCFFVFVILLFIFFSNRNMNKVLSNPAFTVGEIRRIVLGTKTSYVEFMYKVDDKEIVNEQSRSLFSGGKRRLDETKGYRYLVVYNREQPDKSHMINVRVWQHLGADLTKEFNVDSLFSVGLLSVGDF